VALEWNHVAGYRILARRIDRIPRFLIEVLEDDLRKRRRVLQRRQDAGLAVVRVVAQRPVELAGGRPRPVPFALALIAASGGGERRVVTTGAASGSRPAGPGRRPQPHLLR